LRASNGCTERTSAPSGQLRSSSMPEILVERAGGLVTVTLNRPERLNAITNDMWVQLATIFHEVSHRLEDRVLVVTGAGTAFCSGVDLASGTGGEARSAIDHMRVVGEAAMALHRVPKPTIARVDGVAAGAGLNLALGCDLIAASDRSRFSEIFARRGLSVDFGGSWLLPRLVGLHKAKELVLLANMLNAAEAAEIGLVNRVVAAEELDSLVSSWVDLLLAGPPIALSLSKQLLNKSFETSMDQALEAEAQAQSVNSSSADAREARAAFMEKREPRFQGR
jgi:enoyl-CoA hydratase/carnithine racemase